MLLFSLTPLGIIRYIYLRLTKREVYYDGQCNQCGNCCRHLYLLDYLGRVIKKEKQFKKLVKMDNAYSRFEIVEDEGDALVFKCNWHTEEGICSDHENRLPLCRNYPNEAMYYTNFQLGDDCGYTLRTGKSFKNAFDKKLEEVKSGKDIEPLIYDTDFDFLEEPTDDDEGFNLDQISTEEEDKKKL